MNYHLGRRSILVNQCHLSHDPYGDDDEYIQTLRSFIQNVEDNKKRKSKYQTANFAENTSHDPWMALMNDPYPCLDTTSTNVPNNTSQKYTHTMGDIAMTNGNNNNRPIPLKTVNVPQQRKMYRWIILPISKVYNYCFKSHNEKVPEYKMIEDGNDGAYLSLSDFSVYRIQFNDDENLFLNCCTKPISSRFTVSVSNSTSSRYVYC
jgi:hypothetical protein